MKSSRWCCRGKVPNFWRTLKAKCREHKLQSWAYAQRKMPRPWRPTHSKMAMKSGARYSRCGTNAAFQQWGTLGTALRKVFYKLLCRRQQRLRRNWPANALLSQKIRATSPWFQDLSNRPARLRKLLGDFQIIRTSCAGPADHFAPCCESDSPSCKRTTQCGCKSQDGPCIKTVGTSGLTQLM